MDLKTLMSYSLQSVTLSAFVGWANKFTTETEEPTRAKFLVFILVPQPEFAAVDQFSSVVGKTFLPISVSAAGEVMTTLSGTNS